MQKQPILILFISFIIGIFLQDFFQCSSVAVYIILIFSLIIVTFCFIKNFYFYKVRPVLIGSFVIGLGVFAHFLHSQKPLLPELKGKEMLTFKVFKKLNSNEKNRRYEITAWKGSNQFQSVISIPKQEEALDYLHYYQGEVYINKVEKAYSDFQFDYQKYLQRKGIYYQSYLPNTVKIANRTDISFSENVKQRRLAVLTRIDHSKLNKRTREFVKGIILADRTEMDEGTIRDFRDSGMMHILAISGTHVAIIFGVILMLLNFVFPPKYRSYKIIVALIIIWSFACFIDFGNSVVRSCLMISTYYSFVLLQRKTDLLHSLSLAGLIILVLNTNQIFEVGFQLSFAAVLGIFWFNQPILKKLPKPKNKFQNFILNIFSISLAAQLATLPLVIFYFHQYSFISIIANLIIIPFAEVLIVLSLLMVVLIASSISFSWLNMIFEKLISMTLQLIHFFADVDYAMSRTIPMTLLEVGVLYILLYLIRFPLKSFTLKHCFRVLYLLLLFVSLRCLLNYKASHLNEVLVHQFFKEKVISEKVGERLTFYISENTDQIKIKQYIIDPYLSSRRIKAFSITTIPNNLPEIEIQGEKYILKP
ncbi:ComEC family competence protein [Chryseobacterium sp. SNU WT5]|uniref:ComEC/Rec2 family competence protein n=1 Tax=Chryseobacterium sp. SNU WT5 TaxID=2594269 RepID=UPI00117E2059|nr:ComEC/Rec2 family competence protein [Chryseobacterium sp. SNU WT5]QDP84800.1 ComEC family competence protein [Chryseobacterium sp. SNU WT5]